MANSKKLIISITGMVILSALTISAIYFFTDYDFSYSKRSAEHITKEDALPNGFDLNYGMSAVNELLKDRFNGLPEYEGYRVKIANCFESKYLDMYRRYNKKHKAIEIAKKTELICLGILMSSISFDEYLKVRKKVIVKFTQSTIKESESYRYMTGFYEELNREGVIYAGEANLISSVEIINKTLGINVVISDDVLEMLDYKDIDEKMVILGYSGRFIDIMNQIAREFQLAIKIEGRSVVFDLPEKVKNKGFS